MIVEDKKIEDLRGGAGLALVTGIPLGIAGFIFVLLFGLSFISGFAARTPFWAVAPFTFAVSAAALIISVLLIILAVKRFGYAKLLSIDNAVSKAGENGGSFSLRELAANTPIPIEKLQKRLNQLVEKGVIEYEKEGEDVGRYRL